MKRMSLITVLAIILLPLVPVRAQTWKTQIQQVAGSERTKTLKLKPGTDVTVGSLLIDSDSVTLTKYYYGKFESGDLESMTLNLKSIKSEQTNNGIQVTTVTPGKYLVNEQGLDSGLFRVPFNDIHYLDYRDKLSGWVEIGEPIILLSLLTMVAAPLISLDYKEGKINAETYKKWGVGATIGVLAGITTVMTIGAVSEHGRHQFKVDWPNKRMEVWKFK